MWVVLPWLLAALLSGVAGQGLPCPSECECFFNSHALLQADCSARGLFQLPEGMDPQTQILDLSDNLFESIPREISKIAYLESLNLSGNIIKTLSGSSLLNLTSLDILDLSENLISRWKDINANTILLPATNLRVLKLSRNPLNDMANLKNTEVLISKSLYTLELDQCGIINLYGKSPISGLTELRHLSMTHNPFKKFQNLVSPSLRSLDLSHCELTYIGPGELNYLPSLVHLTMSHNYRIGILNSIDTLASVSLKTIDLSYCNMDRIVLTGFPNLEEANLRGNMVRHLNARDFINNFHMVSLDMSSNAIASIHENALEGLNSLRYFNLSVNVIPSINEDILLRTPNLTVVNLSRNYISSVGKLKSRSLLSLDLSFCEIQHFDSDSLDGLLSLLEINLSRNLIGSIPDNLNSPTLQIMDLSFNRLSSINNYTFHLLPELTTLYLSENRFTDTWKWYYFLGNPKLSEISLKDNTWRCDCFEKDMKTFFDYLTNDPPKVWNTNSLMCHSPPNASGRNWLEACYFTWNPETSLSPNQRALTFVFMVFAGFFVTCFIIMLIRRVMRKRLKAAQEEQERLAEEARDRLRQARIRREQEQQLNAPDPRDLISPPSYAEALLMPKLDGSFHSLSGVGLGQDQEKKPRRKARRRTRSSGDLYEEGRSSERIRNRRSGSRTRRRNNPEPDTPTEESGLTSHRSEGNLDNVCMVQITMQESDL